MVGTLTVAPSPGAAVGEDSSAAVDTISRAPVSIDELPPLDALSNPVRYLSQHSRSFRFSASLMRGAHQARVARVYAWCRYTDNLVDDDVPTAVAERRLDGWLRFSWDAYCGRDSGNAFLNRVMGELAEGGIPFAYPHDLVRAMRSDLNFSPYADLNALRVYTYRAAGVVGRWLTELHGVRDRWMLERAGALGQAMQLTNILRDVGEDLDRGRVYLPSSSMRELGVTRAELETVRHTDAPVSREFCALLQSLIDVADADYELAAAALPLLPVEFRRPAAVASAVYRGIHRAIRRNGYDTLRKRAYTTFPEKIRLAGGALLSLARSHVTAVS